MPTGSNAARLTWSEATALEVIEAHRHLRGPLLPILHALQEAFGYIDPLALPLVASALNLSRADVHGVVTFYRDFRTSPPGTTRVMVCRAEACQAMGSADLVTHAQRRLGVELGGTTADGSVTLDQVFCLGNCALSPAVLVDGKVHGRVYAARFDDLVSAALVPSDLGGAG